MRYIEVKDADRIVSSCPYVVNRPQDNKNKWAGVFGNNNPIHIELGMGRGEMIIKLAQQNPNINYIGLELYPSQMVSAVKKLSSLNLKNLKLICADAANLLDFFGKEIDTIYLTFSEPWPKEQDKKRRFTHESYLKIYDRIFKKNKHIILKTDNKVLFAYSMETLSQYWYSFDRVSMDLHHDERKIPNVMTDFEKQYFQEVRQIYYVDASFKG